MLGPKPVTALLGTPGVANATNSTTCLALHWCRTCPGRLGLSADVTQDPGRGEPGSVVCLVDVLATKPHLSRHPILIPRSDAISNPFGGDLDCSCIKLLQLPH